MADQQYKLVFGLKNKQKDCFKDFHFVILSFKNHVLNVLKT